MVFLLDANALIALGDPKHVHHLRVQQWFHSQKPLSWATCPLTENAFLRIVGNPGYPVDYGKPEDLRFVLRRICSWPGHQFWGDEISLLDAASFPKLAGSKKLTDLYLLGLATHKRGQLATLDQRIDPAIVPGGTASYFLIP